MLEKLFSVEGLGHNDLFDGEVPWEWLRRLKDHLHHQELWPTEERVGGLSIRRSNEFVDDEEPVRIHPEAQVSASATIFGPAYIGKNCLVGQNALIRGGCLMLEGSKVGHCSELVASILLPGAKLPHRNYVGNSVIGQNVNLGNGSCVSNLRNDHKNVVVTWETRPTETGLKKFGALIGEDCQIGCGVVLNPGTILERGCMIEPNLTVSRTHWANTKITARYLELLKSGYPKAAALDKITKENLQE